MLSDPQSLIILLIVGAIAGWLAGTIVKGYGFGLIGNIVVGVVGAFVGGWIFATFLGTGGGGFFISLFTAFIGAVVLLWLIRLIVPARA